MLALALDTSSNRLLLALGDTSSGKLLAQDDVVVENHGPGLVSRMENLFAGFQLADVGAIACGLGPGSFTGLRIGLSFAKTFAHVRGLQLHVLDVFDLYHSLVETLDPVVVLQDARRQELYACGLEPGGRRFWEPCVTTLEHVFQSAPTKAVFLGTGARLHDTALRERFGESSMAEAGRDPDVLSLWKAALGVFISRQPLEAVGVEPLYLRASDAELNLAAGKIRSAWSRVVGDARR